jgi:hypothetical protein
MTAGLLALAVALLSGCGKEGPADTGQALRFSVNILPETRTYISGTTLVESSTGNHLPLFVSGTFYGQDGATAELLSAQKFEYSASDAVYHASPDPVYWPMGGHGDFLVYACDATAPASNPTVTWPGVHVADAASFAFTDTKAADLDLVWGVANDRSNAPGAIPITLSHAMARLELEIRTDLPSGRLQVKSVALQNGETDFVQLAGTFSVDNTRIVPVASWSGLSATSDHGFFSGQQVTFTSTGLTSLEGLLDGTARQARIGSTFVPFVSMYVPAQPSKNLVITFTIGGGADIVRTVNVPLANWEMGRSYKYQLEFGNDILLDVTINAWQNGNSLNMELQ